MHNINQLLTGVSLVLALIFSGGTAMAQVSKSLHGSTESGALSRRPLKKNFQKARAKKRAARKSCPQGHAPQVRAESRDARMIWMDIKKDNLRADLRGDLAARRATWAEGSEHQGRHPYLGRRD